MSRRYALALAVALNASGCASGPPFIDQMQPQAVSMAENRARFALDCPTATGSVVNREELQPLFFGGPVRARYSIGVTGCDKRTLVDVLCSSNNNQCLEGR
jgi:hypothetical protein